MSDTEDAPPASGESPGGGETSPPPRDNSDADVPQLEGPSSDSGAIGSADGSEQAPRNHRDAIREQFEEGSEVSSMDASLVDAVPRRVGSPVESVTSALGYSPSVQVCRASIQMA